MAKTGISRFDEYGMVEASEEIVFKGMKKNENISFECLLNDYDKLISCDSLGFYNCCEMVSVFLMDNVTKEVCNVYTIFVFDERVEVEQESTYLTDKPFYISGELSLGIKKKVLNLQTVRNIYKILCESRNKQEIDIGDGKLKIGKLEAVPKVFVQQNSTKEVLLNKVLKNNFKNGSYLLEFFEVDKKVKNVLKTSEFRKMTDEIYRILPIDLFAVSDRIGNFVFQFPSLNIRTSYCVDEIETKLTYNVSLDQRVGDSCEFQLLSEGSSDDTIVAFGTTLFGKEGVEVTFSVGDASRLCKSTVIDLKNQLLLSRQDTSMMREISNMMELGAQYGEQRVIYDKDGQVVDQFEIKSAHNIHVGPPVIRLRDDYVKNRQYRRRVDELYIRAEFRQYGIVQESDKARRDLISLMNRARTGKVYLWDPYLTVEDILNTWYYTTSFNASLYAITSGEIAQRSHISVKKWIKEQNRIIGERSNHYGIQAELRCQWNNHGYRFHDRFLMLIEESNKPQVWSLGSSVNSLGKKHHIIQCVEHPQMIVDTFEVLWDELSDPECLVWKRKS